jgi:heme-degrading monooxygenase HmoA
MGELYTSGVWTVQRGREDDFADAWGELARWTLDNVAGSKWAKLLQNQEDETRFVSFGPWESAEAIEQWRASPGFQERVERIRSMLESFQPGTFELRAEAGTKR